MKSDVEKLIAPRVAAAFADILSQTSSNSRQQILEGAQQMVKAV